MKRKRAFTLIEMMVVILILSYFLITTIPNLYHILTLASSKTCEAQVNLVNAAILQYKMEYQHYPQTLDNLIQQQSVEAEQLYCDGERIRYENFKAKKP
ncbi:MAG: prepilin-type N-terminal cleavage/methylation domain-containing protein [Erysipelothrix sp.]|nr:prepilin-type N-terminal cleavage/methylation domain-containing protein [Erysipelothrix sp.]